MTETVYINKTQRIFTDVTDFKVDATHPSLPITGLISFRSGGRVHYYDHRIVEVRHERPGGSFCYSYSSPR